MTPKIVQLLNIRRSSHGQRRATGANFSFGNIFRQHVPKGVPESRPAGDAADEASLGGQVRAVRIDRLIEGAYGATAALLRLAPTVPAMKISAGPTAAGSI
jgi:hypothetical protein